MKRLVRTGKPSWTYNSVRIMMQSGYECDKINPSGVHSDCSDIIIATGARAVLPPIKNLPEEGIYTMRTADDARKLRGAADSGISGPVRSFLLHQAANPGTAMTGAGRLILARSGMPADIIKKLGGA